MWRREDAYLSAWKIPLLCLVQYVALYCRSVVRSSTWAQVLATMPDPIGERMVSEAPFPACSPFEGNCLRQWVQSTSSIVCDSGTSWGAAEEGGCLSGEALLFSSQYSTVFTILRRHEPVPEGKHYHLYVLLSEFISRSLGLLKSFLQYLHLRK